ncbi:hypothetical protein Ae201684P_005504 [Aphanomyces euteiches]|nr:hypothetical protein Ae201684P_005504 [Aphanomyces euteiches]
MLHYAFRRLDLMTDKLTIAFLLNDDATDAVLPWTRKCKTDGCFNYAASKGLCIRHGGGKRCGVTGCPAGAKNYGLCWRLQDMHRRRMHETIEILRPMLVSWRSQAMRLPRLHQDVSDKRTTARNQPSLDTINAALVIVSHNEIHRAQAKSSTEKRFTFFIVRPRWRHGDVVDGRFFKQRIVETAYDGQPPALLLRFLLRSNHGCTMMDNLEYRSHEWWGQRPSSDERNFESMRPSAAQLTHAVKSNQRR